jgi:hypothetical protein
VDPGLSDEIALVTGWYFHLVVFPASNLAGFSNGQNFRIDGGAVDVVQARSARFCKEIRNCLYLQENIC